MLTVVSAILYTVAVLIAILLVALVLVQPSKGGGFGSAFGGIGEGVFGAQTMGYLSRLTVIMIAVFFLVTLGLAALSGHKQKTVSAAAESAALQLPTAMAPAAPAKDSAKAPAKPAEKTPVAETAANAAKDSVKKAVEKAENVKKQAPAPAKK